MKSRRVFIIDFDSTFVQVESLDELAKKALQNNPNKEAIQKEIEEITRQGMDGTIGFAESLAQRLYLFKPTKDHISELVSFLKRKITPSIKANKEFFKQNADNIYIISGGFKEYIVPVVSSFGIKAENVLANEFQFNEKGIVIGFNDKNPLSKDKGKSKMVKKLKFLSSVKIHVLGDGYTDYEMKKDNVAHYYYAFTENVTRPKVVEVADAVIPNFDDFLFRLKVPASVSYPKNRMKVLLLEKIDKIAVNHFKQEGYEVITSNHAMDEDELVTIVKDISILGIRSKTNVSKRVLKAAKKLHAIGAYCIGTNQVDLLNASQMGIACYNAPYSNTRSVVELVMAYIFSLLRRLTDKNNLAHLGKWQKDAAGCFEVRGKKLGIIGYGNIGSQLSSLAEAMGMEVYFYNRSDKLTRGNAKRCASMEELLRKVDVVSVHVYGTPENKNLIGKKQLAQMKKGSYLINASRGDTVNIEALREALVSGHLAGAAVDVFDNEPKKNTEKFTTILQGLPNAILTPHIGGSTEEAQRDIAYFVSKRLTQFINTGETTLSVNFPNLQLPPAKNGSRIIHIHKNTPGKLALINSLLAKAEGPIKGEKLNIEGQYLKTNETIGYVIVDINGKPGSKLISDLKKIPDTIKVRVLY